MIISEHVAIFTFMGQQLTYKLVGYGMDKTKSSAIT